MINNASEAKELVLKYSQQASEKYVNEILSYVEKVASNGESVLEVPENLCENWVCTVRILRSLGFGVYDSGVGEIKGPAISW